MCWAADATCWRILTGLKYATSDDDDALNVEDRAARDAELRRNWQSVERRDLNPLSWSEAY